MAVDGSQWKSGDNVGIYGSQTNFGYLGISYTIASRVGPLGKILHFRLHWVWPIKCERA